MEDNNTVTVIDWLISHLITIIPGVGLVMLVVWAFGSNTKPSKANWAKSKLLWYLVTIPAISFLVFLAIAFGVMDWASEMIG